MLTWLPLILLPLVVLAFRSSLPAWLFMWLLAISIFAGFKWLTWQIVYKKGIFSNTKHILAYLFFWPGMDAESFLQRQESIFPPSPSQKIMAIFKTLFGGVCFWGIARLVPDDYPILIGWIGMLGMIFILHFGIFHLLALFWQSKGLQAEHMFQSPLFSHSLADFWGKRWNRGFRQLAHQFIFQPLRPHVGVPGATFAVFLFSGLIHDLVISLPAQGGYGLPTFYFLIQGGGVLLERSSLGKKWGFDHGFRGWIFTLIFTATPAYCLFHPIFIKNVILPFMDTLHAFS